MVIRTWLKDNKVFFDTIAAALLALMAIVVSLAQMSQSSRQSRLSNKLNETSNLIALSQTDIAKKQTVLLDLQTKIARQAVLPHFIITAKQIRDETGMASDDKIFVENAGSIVRELHCKYVVYLDVELFPMDPSKAESKKVRLPLNGYYGLQGQTPGGRGRVVTLSGNKNNERAVQLNRAFGQLAKTKGFLGFSQVRRYVHLRYKDTMHDSHEEYFHVPIIYGAHKLTTEEGVAVFGKHRRGSPGRILEFEKLTAEKLLAEVLK